MLKIAGIPLNVVFILVVELCERFCYYTIQGSQKFFLAQRLGYSNAQSTSITTVFNTACYLSCLGGGALGDRFLGRYCTVVLLSILYVAGVAAVAWSTEPDVDSKALFFAGAFLGVAVGTGGIKPIVCNFGADQVGDAPGMERARERFFSYYYWMINVGSALALGIMTTVATSPEAFGIDPGYGYFVSYGIAALSMAACLGIFLAGSCTYVKKFLRSQTRLFRPVGYVLLRSASRSIRGATCLLGWLLLVPFFTLVFMQAFSESGSSQANQLAWTAFIVALVQLSCLVWAHCDNTFLVDDAGSSASPDRVLDITIDRLGQAVPVAGATSPSLTEIRQTFQTLPMILVANTIFNFAYTMMIGPFLSQSCQMDLRFGTGGQQVSGAFFNLGDSLAIIAFIPVIEGALYPWLERHRLQPLSPESKMLGGFFWAALAMVAGVVIEYLRRSSPVLAPKGWSAGAPPAVRFPGMPFTPGDGPKGWEHYESLMGRCQVGNANYCSNCAPKRSYPFCEGSDCADPGEYAGIYMSALSGFWMLIPFAFIGIGEIMVNPVLYYYAYEKTPAKTQSIIQAVNLVFQGAYPPALVGVFSTVFSSAQPNNLNDGHIEVFYYLALAIIALGTPVFLYVARTCVLETPVQLATGSLLPRSSSSIGAGASIAGGVLLGSMAGNT